MSAGDDLAADYRALRHGVGARRSVREVVGVRGPDATAYLQGQVSQDVAALAVGAAADALVLEPDGKLDALVRVVHSGPEEYLLDVDPGWGEIVLARLRRFRLRTKVDLDANELAAVCLRGPGVGPHVREGVGGDAVAWLPVTWGGTPGVDVLGAAVDWAVPPDAAWVGAAAFEALRVEAGVPRMGAELDQRTIPAEAGLVERAVSFTKGCYTGQELVARLDARGSRVARRLCGLVLSIGGETLAPDELLGGALWAPGGTRAAGRCTSAAWCPGLGALGALGYVHRSVEPTATLTWVRGDGPPDDGDPVDAAVSAVVRALPLVGADALHTAGEA